MKKSALVVGSGGQDGRILSAQLLSQGFRVVGVDVAGAPCAVGTERSGVELTDREGMHRLVEDLQPSEVYYLAAFHHASAEREQVEIAHLLRQSFQVNVDGLVSTVEALRVHARDSRLFYASSSHVFGAAETSPQDEATLRKPQSAYGVSKCAGMDICRIMREQHGMFAVSGVLYNHESVFRGAAFVTAKIARGAAHASRALARGEVPAPIELGSLESLVDWSAAEDVTRAMQATLRAPLAQDYVVASGILHSVRDFCRIAFDEVGLDWEAYVRERPGLRVQAGVPLVGNAARLRQTTGWEPLVSFEGLVRRLVRENMS